MDRKEHGARVIGGLDLLELGLEELELIIGNRRPMPPWLDMTPGSSSALLNRQMIRTNGASRAK
jgi:hypothetical protein